MLKVFLKKLPFFREFSFIFILNAVLIVGYIAIQHFLPPIIPLFYGLPKGESQLAPRIAIVIPPLLSIIITLINIIVISFLKNEFINKILLSISAVVTLLSAVTTLHIIALISML